MHRIFQNFVEHLSSASDPEALCAAMSDAAAALDLSCFAYLSVAHRPDDTVGLISNYPSAWTKHYLQRHYERFDPVIVQALGHPEPFEWGLGARSPMPSEPQRELFEKAAEFGIRCGFTVPIHDNRGPTAAVTFAADQRRPEFERAVRENGRVLQLMAVYFHAHVRRKLVADRIIDGVAFSPREMQCLRWAAQGKSAWETGRILGISRYTVAFHLDNARTKLGVRSTIQAVGRLTASRAFTY
jgi:LuxR family transcriptional regulator, activator of conjugal transfer of Ti plasmids